MSHGLKENRFDISSLQHSAIKDGKSRSKRIKTRSKVRKSRRSKVRKSRRSKVRRSKVKKSRRSKVRKSRKSKVRKSRKSKLYKITDLDKLVYRLNKFPGLNKEIFKFLPAIELRGFLNDESYDDLLDKHQDQIDVISNLQTDCKLLIKTVKKDCENKIKPAKKELRFLEKNLDVIHEYVNSGIIPRNYRQKYPFLKILKK